MNKRKNRKTHPKCPCCGVERHRTEMEMAISDLERLEKSKNNYYKELKIDSYVSFIQNDFDWACDYCLKSKKAIKANPKVQNYCWNPYYAYFDSEYKCRTCNNEFTFNKEEKMYWFENLKFWIDSVPVNCIDCRKDIRQQKSENKIVSNILTKAESDISIIELETVIDIYEKWGKVNRVNYYKSILRKRKK